MTKRPKPHPRETHKDTQRRHKVSVIPKTALGIEDKAISPFQFDKRVVYANKKMGKHHKR